MAPGCFSQSINNKESVSLTPEMASSMNLKPTDRAIHLFTSPLSLSEGNKRASIDTFEILEQTIIKQKRLAKLKNTDLRKKMLLKRMFDLICDTMDMENGFNENDGAPSTMVSGSSNNVACEETEETSELELELHDHSKMDEDESGDEEPAKLAELKPVQEETDSQVLPRQIKRRASCGHNDEEETFFCESHSSDQQLNWRCSHDASATLPDLKIYSDDSNASVAVSIEKSRRTDHQRNAKRIRTH